MDGLVNLASTVGDRARTNLGNSVSSMSAQQWIRLVTIVGAYMLLRPYLVKLVAKVQAKQLEKGDAEEAAAAAEERAKISPNELRGHRVAIPDDSSDSEAEGDAGEKPKAAAVDWGRKARRRQRQVMKRMLAEHEKRLAEQAGDEEDKDIEEFLVD